MIMQNLIFGLFLVLIIYFKIIAYVIMCFLIGVFMLRVLHEFLGTVVCCLEFCCLFLF